MMTYEDYMKLFIDSYTDKMNGIQSNDKNYFGYNCVYAPEEILHAAGFTPIRLFPSCDRMEYHDSCLHPRSCEFARNLHENFESGIFDYLKGILFVQCCDSLRAIYELLSNKKENIFFINIPLEVTNLSDHFQSNGLDFFSGELILFKNSLEKHYKIEISDESIKNSVSIYEENHSLLKEITKLWKDGAISARDYFHIQRSGLCMRKEDHNLYLLDFISWMEKEKAPNNHLDKSGKPVMLVGGINGNYKWIEYLDKLGAKIVAYDICEIIRNDNDSIHRDDNLYKQLVLSNATKNCPMKIDIKNRFDIVYKKYIESGAKGIIFLIFQYCDPKHLDYATIKVNLIKYEIPTLLINTSVLFLESGQLTTRIEAFLEMIGS